MAFGSGSSLATDCWMRRIGLPSSAQLLKVGRASRLHQHSSSKPTTHSGSDPAISISLSRRLFSLVEEIGRGEPPLTPHPSPPKKARKSSPGGPPRAPPLGDPLLEGDLRRHLKGPEATVVAELPRSAVEQLPQGLGAVLVESVASSLGTRRFGHQSIQAPRVEVVDGVAHRLLATSEVRSYSRSLVSPRRS